MERFAAIAVAVLALAAMAASVTMLARYSVDSRINTATLLIITTTAAMLTRLSGMMSHSQPRLTRPDESRPLMVTPIRNRLGRLLR